MYSVMPNLGLIGFDDNPTTAMFLLSLNIFVIGSPSPRPPISAPPGMCTLMTWPPVFPLPHLLPLFPLLPGISLSSRGEFALARALQDHPRHGRQTLVIFFRRPHRNTDRFRKSHPSQRPHDHAHPQQIIAQGLRFRTHYHKHKIRLARHRPASLLRPSLAQAVPLPLIRFDAPG